MTNVFIDDHGPLTKVLSFTSEETVYGGLRTLDSFSFECLYDSSSKALWELRDKVGERTSVSIHFDHETAVDIEVFVEAWEYRPPRSKTWQERLSNAWANLKQYRSMSGAWDSLIEPDDLEHKVLISLRPFGPPVFR